jgi:hypothetical protein
MNYGGYIHEEIPVGSRIFGGDSISSVLIPERDWSLYIPKYETQMGNGFDSLNCTNFSLYNCNESYEKRVYGTTHNYSDRFAAYVSGNTKEGNTFSRTANALSIYGVVPEERWPNAKTVTSWDEYMVKPPQLIFDEGKRSLDVYTFDSMYVGLSPDELYEALGHGTLRVAVHAWDKPINGIYTRTLKAPNHAVQLFKGTYGKNWFINDHYDQGGNSIKTLAWDFKFWAAQLHTLTITPMSQFKIAKQENGKGYALLCEAQNEEELKTLCKVLGVELPIMDGKIEWDLVKHESTYKNV